MSFGDWNDLGSGLRLVTLERSGNFLSFDEKTFKLLKFLWDDVIQLKNLAISSHLPLANGG
jgi:hypothetical protein